MSVARAMSEQTKEVPRSAVHVFAQKKVIVDYGDVARGSQRPSSRKPWALQKPRVSMSIHGPGIAAGHVPPSNPHFRKAPWANNCPGVVGVTEYS